MSFGKIYTYPDNTRVIPYVETYWLRLFLTVRALAAAAFGKLQVDVPAFQMGTENKSPEFLKKFPVGKVPAFEGADGVLIFESDAISYYSKLKPFLHMMRYLQFKQLSLS